MPHTGGFVPYIRGRVGRLIDEWTSPDEWIDLEQSSQVYFDKLYVDTVAHSPAALEYCYKMFGPERLLYGTGSPLPALQTLKYSTKWWMDWTVLSPTGT